MLSIILKILGVLGIILLVLLGVILTILLLVLFFPICYRIKADRQPVSANDRNSQFESDAPDFAVHADVKAWWLFGLLRARYQYPTPGILKVKLLFFTIYRTEKDMGEEPSEPDTKDNTDEQTRANRFETSSQDRSQDGHESSSQSSEQTSPKIETKPTFIEKIQYTIQKFYAKIKDGFKKLKEIRDNIAYYKEVLSSEEAKGLLQHASKRLGKILKSIRPRKLHVNLHYGASSPDITGYACAVYGILCSYLGKHVVFTPNFEQEILEGNLYAAGHITIFKVLWNGLMIGTDRRLWLLKDKLTQKPTKNI